MSEAVKIDFNFIEQKLANHDPLNRDDAIGLLKISNQSDEFYRLMCIANSLSRNEYGNKGYIFAQIGLNAEPCTGGCRFCSLAQSNFSVEYHYRLTVDEAVMAGLDICRSEISDLFLMTTADYPFEHVINIATKLRKSIPKSIRLVANIGDFTYEQAMQLKVSGFSGAYHIHRLNEGIDTDLSPDRRIDTLNNVHKAGLELYYCVEPIGPEHTYEALVDEMLRARKYGVDVMAAMRRVPVPGTDMEKRGTITLLELTKIAAVTRLVTRPKRSMNVHEPTEMALLAGVNQLYAEYGANPRDTLAQTSKGRGSSIQRVKQMLENANYIV